MDALTGVPLSRVLLFCLFSLCFGMLLAVLIEGVRAFLTALRLLPGGEISPPRPTSLCPLRVRKEKKEQKTEKKRKYSVRELVGCFVFDVVSFVMASVLYLIFLFAENGGAFRFYSMALAVCGFFLFRGVAVRFLARPLLYVLSWTFSVLGLFLRFLPWLFLFVFRRLSEKKEKQLDEKEQMV